MLKTKYPIIQAPMAGGVSTPLLAAAVCNAGGIGFLAAGYKSAKDMQKEIHEVRTRTSASFGVNLFVPNDEEVDEQKVDAYKKTIEKAANQLGAALGEPRQDDDDWNAKLLVLAQEKVPVVSFTFGCPSPEIISALKQNGSYIMITVTTPDEAKQAVLAGADALCIQGIEAGGHRGTFQNNQTQDGDYTVEELLQLLNDELDIPLIAAGGIMTGGDITRILKAGASAVQLGTAFICCKESGASEVYKSALLNHTYKSTAVTRSFTGRRARGLVNKFLSSYTSLAPAAYPHIHHMTKPIRTKAAEQKNAEYLSLWAGTGYDKVQDQSVAELMSFLVKELEE
ncbi:nitronate monooxygenase [Priestia megaterium]|nr:nitronate monooxygenase [Priestia megaterium]